MGRHLYLVKRGGSLMNRQWKVVKGPVYPNTSKKSGSVVAAEDMKADAVSRASELVRNTGARGRLEYRYARTRPMTEPAKAVRNPDMKVTGGEIIMFTFDTQNNDGQPALIDSEFKDMRSNAHYYASGADNVLATAEKMLEKLGYERATMTSGFEDSIRDFIDLLQNHNSDRAEVIRQRLRRVTG